MSRPIPPIETYMTASPHTIGVEQSLDRAMTVMEKHGVRHLPVLRGGKLVGLLSQRDVAVVSSLPGIDPSTESVEDAMTPEVYSVAPQTPLDEVTEQMARRKLGSVVVMRGGHVVGVFTTVDVCRALTEILRDAPQFPDVADAQ